jgi:hypothetical protein
MDRLPQYLEQLGDHRLHGTFLTNYFLSWTYHRSISDPEDLVKKGLEHFNISKDRSGEG